MAYKILSGKSQSIYEFMFQSVYCDWKKNPITTFDGIEVKFFPNQFHHVFFESQDWKRKDKSIFSPQRAERIFWIKDALEDSTADLRQGWISKTKSYDRTRRVAIVKTDYVVIISITGANKAKFISAYKADKSIGKILMSPKW